VKNVYDDVAWITKLLFLIFNIKHKYKNKSTNYFAYILLLLKFADENTYRVPEFPPKRSKYT